jgi:hypothetical protein
VILRRIPVAGWLMVAAEAAVGVASLTQAAETSASNKSSRVYSTAAVKVPAPDFVNCHWTSLEPALWMFRAVVPMVAGAETADVIATCIGMAYTL